MLSALLNIVFPPVCALCETDIADGVFCLKCNDKFSDLKITAPICRSCGMPFTNSLGPDHTCGKCLTEKMPFKEARSALFYDKCVVEAVHGFKYHGKVILAAPLGRLTSQAALFSSRPDVIVPVPLHKKRLRMRGFNQSLLLANEISKNLSISVDFKNLTRIRHTEQQINLTAQEREKNVSGAFEIVDKAAFKAKKVLLVDDVYTTGATIKECSKVLKKAGAEIFALTLARAAMV
ncbi:MAG: ComF family protein [Deltaproteobacteria bacterium]|nr:ComF family protein [Deltaproteobacteria bacterium]